MGQKIRPSGLRLGIIRDWDSRWFADRSYREFLLEDIKIRAFILKKYNNREADRGGRRDDRRGGGDRGGPKFASIRDIVIERRVGDAVRVTVCTARPGVLIGQGGAGVELLKTQIEQLTGRRTHVNVVEIRHPQLNAGLVAESVARSIERRESFRRAMKQQVQRTMEAGAKGVKVIVSGRLGGAEIARSESLKEGKIPLHTIRADIDYGVMTARTKYGPIGVKVWIYKGDVLPGEKIERDAEPKGGRPAGRGGPGGRGPRVRQAPAGAAVSLGGPGTGGGPRRGRGGPGGAGRGRQQGGSPDVDA
jgi:small subunit ribosomal protein S3